MIVPLPSGDATVVTVYCGIFSKVTLIVTSSVTSNEHVRLVERTSSPFFQSMIRWLATGAAASSTVSPSLYEPAPITSPIDSSFITTVTVYRVPNFRAFAAGAGTIVVLLSIGRVKRTTFITLLSVVP